MVLWRKVLATLAVVGAVGLLCACTVGGAQRETEALPSLVEVAAYDWGDLQVDLRPSPYPRLGRDALADRPLPWTQVAYTAISPGPRPEQLHQFVATLFEAPNESAAREFWREHPPGTTYETLAALVDRSSAERMEVERLGRHEVGRTRSDERWSAVCYSPPLEGIRNTCDDYLIWVQWCRSILEVRISTTDRPYRTAEVDRTLRAIVGDIRDEVPC